MLGSWFKTGIRLTKSRVVVLPPSVPAQVRRADPEEETRRVPETESQRQATATTVQGDVSYRL